MKEKLKKISPVIWEIPKDFNEKMQVPARIYASEEAVAHASGDRSFRQLVNVATLPGILGRAAVMPDVHEGYGFPIGAVAAIDYENGIISPGGIGYDINCGVRLLKSEIEYSDAASRINALANELNSLIPSGVGKGGKVKLDQKALAGVLRRGAKWAVEEGFGLPEDPDAIESGGAMDGADDEAVSKRAKERGSGQLGTMGAGNHFVEIDRVSDVFDEKAAEIFGLFKNQIVIQIHTGSRGLGHQVATDYIKRMITASKQFDYDLPDMELTCAPTSSELGRDYFAAMAAAANFAWANRQLISHWARKAWKNAFGDGNLSLLYDVAHNIAKVENHNIDGAQRKVIVHRKGATRAFPARHPEIPAMYREAGQPVLIPGSMGTASYVLVGTAENMNETFGSACHGAGRLMSRTAAGKKIFGKDLFNELQKRGLAVRSGSMKALAEEAPAAYKDVHSVVDTVENANIAKKVVKLVPLGVVKG